MEDKMNVVNVEATTPVKEDKDKAVTKDTKFEQEPGTVSGYVSQLSPLKKSRKGTPYFNAVIQTGETEYGSLVCFSPTKRFKLEQAEHDKKAVTLSKVKQKQSVFADFQSEILLNENSQVYSSDVSFDFSARVEKDAPKVTIKEALNATVGNFVTVEAYFNNVDKSPAIPSSAVYKDKPMMRKDILINDKSGEVRLCIWEDNISKITENGTYLVVNARLKSFKDQLYLTATTKTKIILSESVIEATKNPSEASNQLEIDFPPVMVRNIRHRYFCANCKKFQKSTTGNPNLFHCEGCSSTAMTIRLKKAVDAKLDFQDGIFIKTISLPFPQFALYFQNLNMDIPQNDENIQLVFLQDTTTKMFYNDRQVCIGFLKN